MADKLARHFKKYLRDFVAATEKHIAALDATIQKPQSPTRGQELARIINSLEMQKDIAKRFGLKPPQHIAPPPHKESNGG